VRQFGRSIAAFALVALVLLALRACARGGDDTSAAPVVQSRRVDLAALTSTVRSGEPWSVVDGAMSGNATVVLSSGRVLQLTDGTLGESTCLFPDVTNACVLLADTLGDGIVWFSLVSAPPSGSNELELPAISQLLDGVTYARLENGIEVPLLDRVVRRCEEESPNLSSFVQKHRGAHVTILDLERGEVSAVRCASA
jgi:hypothetical protein